MSPRFIAMVCLVAWTTPAGAQCTKDTECKGDRICIKGECVDAPTKVAPSPPGPVLDAPTGAAPSPPGPVLDAPTGAAPYRPGPIADFPTRPADHWARGASTTGWIGAVVVLGLAIGSELTKGETSPSLPLGIAATVAGGVLVPVVASGGDSARVYPNVTGSPALRTAGWVTYAITLVDALALIGMGLADVEPPGGVITSVGVLGGASLCLFAVDASTAANQADAAAGRLGSSGAVEWAPSAMIVPLWDGGAAGLLGASARF